jgi:hypothetical protein
MASNARYQSVPSSDPEEQSSYTQAPPSYQAERAEEGLLGAPRSEYDNVPDDFKVCRHLAAFPDSD